MRVGSGVAIYILSCLQHDAPSCLFCFLEVGIRFVGSADCLMAGFDRSGDELQITGQPTVAIAGHLTATPTVFTIANGAMELPDRIELLGP